MAADLLTSEEQAWLSRHELVWAPCPNYPPVDFFDQAGNPAGISADYLHLLQQKLGFRIKVRRVPTFAALLKEGKAHRIDLATSVQRRPQRERYWRFTSPYLEVSAVILNKTGAPENLTLGSLQGMRVALVRSFAINDYLDQNYPSMKRVPVPDDLTGLRKLATGECEAMIADLPTAVYLIQKEGISGLQVAGDTGFRYQYALASREDWPILSTILEKGRNSVTPEEWNAIYSKWVNVKALDPFDPRPLLVSLGVLLLLAAASAVWILLLRQQVRARTLALEEELQERLKMAEVLKEKDQNYREIYNSTQDAILIHDAQTGALIDTNDAALGMFGYSRREMERVSLGELSLAEEGFSKEAARKKIQQALEAEALTCEWNFRKKDGTPFWGEVVLNKTTLGDRERILSIVRDITSRKSAEAEREKNLAQQRQIEALQESDTLKDQFLGILSHELRSPLNAITGFGSILEDELAGPLNEKQHDYLGKMLASTEHLLFLVNDLLDMTRIQAGKFSINPQPVDFSEIAASALEALRPLARKKGLTIEERTEEVPILEGDPQRLSHVLLNLLNNAIKFTPEGGRISVRTTRRPGGLRWEVEDSGPGIAMEDQQKLFKPFSQLDTSITRKSGGTGLGLSISKAIVESHGGEIGLSSAPGKGSTFWISLPLVEKTGE
ncbi:MAG: ATP-binding protein [Bacteroidota bacterium]